ncbi:hypothetical protein K470DRAFT_40133 [Piedraia hortae CBS 480.64]|uniref:Uncharacterized protein n=1 Tax=Piedraia hortae CBS 480.64 TaxID=1314780 RepID=A0A6A7C1C0_9PEZI|nr:hypothetical protein K470DRAFT_40133 [Piedraia hortae CBS 480.64]
MQRCTIPYLKFLYLYRFSRYTFCSPHSPDRSFARIPSSLSVLYVGEYPTPYSALRDLLAQLPTLNYLEVCFEAGDAIKFMEQLIRHDTLPQMVVTSKTHRALFSQFVSQPTWVSVEAFRKIHSNIL